MSILTGVKSLYDYFEKNDIDTNIEIALLEDDSDLLQKMLKFNKEVMKGDIDDKDISSVVKFLSKKKENLSSYILDILLTNPSFFKNEEVKKVFHSQIEDKIFDDIDAFSLKGEKLKIIDLFFNKDFKNIEPLLDSLDVDDKADILMYIMEHSYDKDVLDKNTEVGAVLSKNKDLLSNIYDEESNMVNFGFESHMEE